MPTQRNQRHQFGLVGRVSEDKRKYLSLPLRDESMPSKQSTQRASHVNTAKRLDRAHTLGTKSSLSNWHIPSVKRGVAGDIMNILVNYALWFKMAQKLIATICRE